MTQEHLSEEKKAVKSNKPEAQGQGKHPPDVSSEAASTLDSLQQSIGNRAVQRLIAQRSGDGSFALDDETEDRIDRERGGGQPLDGAVQARMSDATGHDFSGVKVHTSAESDTLNRELGAKAFTTGQDVFFRSGAYQPQSSDGQELIAHELTHVVQQSSGTVSSGEGMTVNPPGDAYEQEADSVSKSVMSSGAGASIQRQADEEDEEKVQMQAAEEDEDKLQRQPDGEDEDKLQMQPEEDEEEEAAE